MTVANPWWRIGWRNLGRNRRRTLITAAGLAFGYCAVVLMVGLMDGLTVEMVENGTGLLTGQLQVHATDYRPERSLYETIGGREGADVDALLRTVDEEPAIAAAAPRVFAGGLVSSGEATTAAILMGMHPQLEPQVSRLAQGVTRGHLPQAGSHAIAVGVEMARQLAVDLGDEVVVVAPAADGSMGNDLFTVSGVFRTGMTELDGSYALLDLATLQALLALDPRRIHEIAATTADPWLAPDAAARLRERLGASGSPVEVAPWTELRPEMQDYVRLVGTWNWVVLAIVFGIAVFGVANTMLMATFERRREFAVLLALGTTPPAVMLTVVLEALALGLLSIIGGVLVSFPILVWWHNAPPDMSWAYGDFTMFGALVRPVLRVEYRPAIALWASGALLLTAVLAALYPAARAARIPPADTLSGL